MSRFAPLPALLDASRAADHSVALAPDVSWAEFHSRVAAVADVVAAGVADTVVVTSHDPYRVALAILGAWQAGCRVLLPGNLQPGVLGEFIAPRYCLIGDASMGAIVPDALPAGSRSMRVLDPAKSWLELRTSGSTGTPKVVAKCIGQLATEVVALESQWGDFLQDTVILGTVSPQHLYGLLFRVLWPLCAGRPMMREQFVYPEPLLEATAQLPRVAWVSSPSLLGRMTAAHHWASVAGRLQAVFSSGALLPESAALQVKSACGLLPVEIYGSTETGGIAWRQAGTCWRTLAGVQVRAGDGGALAVRSAHVGSHDWWQTDDAANFLEDGFELLGRLDRVVKLEDKRVSLPEVEACLREHPWVAEVSALVLQGTRASLGIAVVPAEAGVHVLWVSGRQVLVKAWRDHLAQRFDRVALPRHVRLVDSLPVNTMGKTDAVAVRRLFEQPLPGFPRVLAVRPEGPGEVTIALQVPLDMDFFSSHFPAVPLVPGVLQASWAVDLAACHLGFHADCRTMEVLKFKDFVRPGMQMDLWLRSLAEPSRLDFRYICGDRLISQGRLVA